MTNKLSVRQLIDAESSTLTYLVFDEVTLDAIVIDPVKEKVARDLKQISELSLKVHYVLDTHAHADHVTGAGDLRSALGSKTVIGKAAGVQCIDHGINDGETLFAGSLTIKALSTPGHTNGCTSFLIDENLFTGDTLLIRGCGRTDFQGGSPETLYKSIKNKIYALPEHTKIFPGHDYNGHHFSTVKEEKKFNPRINEETSEAQFVHLMNNLNLAPPKKIHEALPANLKCGQTSENS